MLKSRQVGTSGLSVSQLCLGTMNFGVPGKGHQGDWTLSIDDARPIFKAALDHGLYYFDCANVYGLGASEEVTGEILRGLTGRDKYVLTTKLSAPMGRNPNQGGLSRKHIMEGIDASLKRLGVDYVDQLIIHRHPNCGLATTSAPNEEAIEALHDVVMAESGVRCRIYAPVGAHRDLLAYLVRRLLENGANSSFVHQIVDDDVPPESIARDPFLTIED